MAGVGGFVAGADVCAGAESLVCWAQSLEEAAADVGTAGPGVVGRF